MIWLLGNGNKINYLQGSAFEKMGILEGTEKIPGYKEKSGGSGSTATQSQSYFQRGRFRPVGYPQETSQRPEQKKPQKGPKREMKWLVAVEGNSPLKIVVTSQKGGTVVKELSIN